MSDEIDYDSAFIELKQTSNETTFSVCKYCLPEDFDQEALKKSGEHHGITIMYLSCNKHNPYSFDE